MQQRTVRTTLTYMVNGQTKPFSASKLIDTVMGDEPVLLVMDPRTGECTVTADGVTDTVTMGSLKTSLTCKFPHNHMVAIGGQYLRVNPKITEVVMMFTATKPGFMRVHAVDMGVTMRGLIEEEIPDFALLERIEIKIESVH